ncbi:MAG: hypothetical protein D3924_07885, partial [Candidatus Electrothrix sp. AR4]|nr:hypothetical protein [Candidatus Electrothrix sp. AR4]
MKSGTTTVCKRLRRYLLVLLLPLLLLSAALILGLTTQPGFRFLLRTADSLAGPIFSVEHIDGRLLSRWRLGKVQVHIQDVVDVTLDTFNFSWSPKTLLHKRLVLHRVAAQGLTVRLASSNKKEKHREKDAPLVLSDIQLPFGLRIDIEDLQLHDGQIYFSENAAPFIINEGILQASAQETQQAAQIIIRKIKLDSPDYGANLQGRIALHKAWPLNFKGDWRLADPGINDLNGSLKAEGNLEKLTVSLSLVTP